jgi:hypothetical protein
MGFEKFFDFPAGTVPGNISIENCCYDVLRILDFPACMVIIVFAFKIFDIYMFGDKLF